MEKDTVIQLCKRAKAAGREAAYIEMVSRLATENAALIEELRCAERELAKQECCPSA